MERLIAFILLFIAINNLTAQTIAQTANFEIFAAGTVTNNNQLAGWTVLASLSASATPDINDNNCNLASCCWTQSPTRCEVISAPNGLIDPSIGSSYPIYSLFGSSPAPAAASMANPQINFPMGGTKFFRLNQHLGSGTDRLSTTILVTDETSFIDIAYISIINRAHNCCNDPGFRIEIDTTSPCFEFVTNDCTNPPAIPNYLSVLTGAPAYYYTLHIYNKWIVRRYDLTPFMGHTVTIKLSAYCCVFGLGPHEGYAYIDARCGSSAISFNGVSQITYETKKTLISCKPSYTLCAPPHYSSYAWSGPASFISSSQSFTNSVSGIYTVVMGQGNNCSSVTRTIEVIMANPLTVIQSHTLCPGKTVTLTATGVSTYTWLNTNTTDSILTVSPLATTIYTVMAADTNGCFFKEEFHLIMNRPPSITVSSTPSICAGETTLLSAFGADAYTWYSTNQQILSHASTVIVGGMLPGPLTFSLLGSQNTCTAQVTKSIYVNPLPIASISVTPSVRVCFGEVVTLLGYGGIMYEWVTPEFKTYTTSQIQHKPMGAEVVSLRVKDHNGCWGYTSQSIGVFKKPKTFLAGRTKDCAPFQAYTRLEVNPHAKLVDWFIEGQKQQGPVFSYLFKTAGIYSVKVAHEDSINGCRDTSEFNFEAHPKPKADFEFMPVEPRESDEVTFINKSSANSVKCEWYFGNEKKTTCQDQFEHSFLDLGSYPLTLLVTTEYNCVDTVTKALKVLPEYNLFVPNAFTPNGDEKNEVFMPVARGVTRYMLEVFDRWGQPIFMTQNILEGWNGFYKGKLCETDIYIWRITLITTYGEKKNLLGQVSLQL